MSSQRLQIETARLRAEVRTLKSTSGTNQTTISSASSAVSDTAAPDQDDDNASNFAKYRGLGKRFAIISELWVRSSLLRRPCPIDLRSTNPWHARRCANDAAWDDGIVAELYFLLPGPYHEFIEGSARFSSEVCEERSMNTPSPLFPLPVHEGRQANANISH